MMPKIDKLRLILKSERERFDQESTKHKVLHRNCRYTVFALTAITTVLGGLALWLTESQLYLNSMVVVTSATIGLITAIEGLRKPAELWILERNIFYSLKDIERKLEYFEGNISDADLDHLFQQMQDLLGASKEKWGQYVAPGNPYNSNTVTEQSEAQKAKAEQSSNGESSPPGKGCESLT